MAAFAHLTEMSVSNYDRLAYFRVKHEVSRLRVLQGLFFPTRSKITHFVSRKQKAPIASMSVLYASRWYVVYQGYTSQMIPWEEN